MVLNINRVGMLIANDLKLKWRIYLMITIIAFAIPIFYFMNPDFTLFSLFTSRIPSQGFNPFANIEGNVAYKFHLTWFPQILFVATSVMTSFSFSEYQNERNANFYLSLPASKLEKWSAKAILYVLFVPVTIIVLYQFFILLTNTWEANHPMEQVKVNVADPYFRNYIWQAIFIQCLIILGALIYKRYSFFKLTLLAIGVYLSYNFLKLVSLVIVNEDINFFNDGNITNIISIDRVVDNAGYYVATGSISSFLGCSETLLLSIVAFMALIISYLRFAELES